MESYVDHGADFINSDTFSLSPWVLKGCICHFTKWQIHPLISTRTNSDSEICGPSPTSYFCNHTFTIYSDSGRHTANVVNNTGNVFSNLFVCIAVTVNTWI